MFYLEHTEKERKILQIFVTAIPIINHECFMISKHPARHSSCSTLE